MKNPALIQLKISLKGSKPLIWRRVQVPANITMQHLHEILNSVMGWHCCHLYAFRVGDETIGDSEWDDSGEWLSDQAVKLSAVIKKTKRFEYEYDFGDGWQHEVLVEDEIEVDSKMKYPVCIAGEYACPPEDSGGLGGFENFKTAIADPKHPEHQAMTEWYGSEYDPKAFDLARINEEILPGRKLFKPTEH